MSTRCRIFFLLAVTLLSATCIAQSSSYLLETFGTRDGMLSSKVYTVYQAADRKLWIGTESGVSVYDGYSFTNYQYTATNESIGRVLSFAQDKQKTVWIGGDKGLFYFKDDSVKRVSAGANTMLAAESLLCDEAGNLWIGDLNALYKISAVEMKSFHAKGLNHVNLSPFASFKKRVFKLAIDEQQHIYIATYDGVFRVPSETDRYEMVWKNPDPVFSVRSVAAISSDSIFLNCLDSHPAQLIKGTYSSNYTDKFIGRTVFSYKRQLYALTTSGVGKFVNGKVNQLFSFNEVTNNAVDAIIDIEGNFWVATWEGLQKFRKAPFQQYTLTKGEQKETFSFLERKNGELLFGSNRGKIYEKKGNGIRRKETIPVLFPLAEVMCMYEDDAAGLWAGSGYQGISLYKNNRVSNWQDIGFLKDNNCEALYPKPDGKLFACTENGVTVINPSLGDPLTAHYPFEKNYSRPPELFGCFQTGRSGYWFYGSRGLYKLQGNKLADDSIINMPVKSLYITRIISDENGNIWVATMGKGLLKCVLQNEKLLLQKQYAVGNGLPSDNILSVLADKNNNLWFGDYMSLSVLINPGEHEQLISYNEKDGLLTSYYQTLKLELQKNGTVWGLTSMGAFSFHPDSMSRNNLIPDIHINMVTVNGIAQNLSGESSLVLSYRNNSIQFQYTAICLTDPSKVRYAYRIKELDSNWTYTNSRTVDLNFLQPGRYSFEIKACNNNNVWTVYPVKYNFSINPPFWKTWWFSILIGVLIAGTVFIVFKRRVKYYKEKAAVKQQLAELEAKAIRAQMNPHFIFNSLNAIQETIITENIDAAYDYLSRFSKLLRMVLDNSEKNLITLSSELQTIRLYLSLEALRFSQSFEYSIVAENQLESDEIFIPSLLIQPFVENAIWHGLINKEGDKKLKIHFKEENRMLECVIEDNGVGRARAREIKMQKLGASVFESKGTRLALQRIEILNRERPGSASIETIDLYDENGKAAGTSVVIRLAGDLILK